jgi:hypothetical protein
MTVHESYNDNIFINCPFDNDYKSFLDGIVFTIIRCGFIPRCAFEHDDASVNRIDKLYKLIEECKYGIHDISHIALDVDSGYPRFNMPFELGLFLGAKRFGNNEQKRKNILIFENKKFSSKIYLSDLNGIDPKAHNNNINKLIDQIRNWLVLSGRRLPGPLVIQKEFAVFTEKILPEIAKLEGLQLDNLAFKDYCLFVEEWLSSHNQ